MNSQVTHKGVTFDLDLYDPPYELKGRGWVHPAYLVGSYDRDTLSNLIGLKLWNSPILAIESFMTVTTYGPIGLLLKEKKW